jgi:hypothetical protein
MLRYWLVLGMLYFASTSFVAAQKPNAKPPKPPKMGYGNPPKSVDVVYEQAAPKIPLSHAQLDSLVQVYTPVISEVMDVPFATKPEVKIVEDFEIVDILQKELTPQYHILYPDLKANEVLDKAHESAVNLSSSLMGKYSSIDKKLYISLRTIERGMGYNRLKMEQGKGIAKIILIHELVHALQDQHLDLTRLILSAHNENEMGAISAVMEGQATWAQQSVGSRLGLDQELRDTKTVLLGGKINMYSGVLKIMQQMERNAVDGTYMKGRDFVQYHFEQGGISKVWEVLEKPPVRYAMILNPSTYSPVREVIPDYTSVFDTDELTISFGVDKKDWIFRDGIGTILNAVLTNVPRERQSQIHASLRFIRIAYLNEKPPDNPLDKKILAVSVFVFDESEMALNYINWIEENATRNVDQLKTSGSLTVEELGAKPVELQDTSLEVNKASQFHFKFKMPPFNQNHVLTRIAKGKLMVEFQTMNRELDLATIEAVFKQIDTRYQALSK